MVYGFAMIVFQAIKAQFIYLEVIFLWNMVQPSGWNGGPISQKNY